MKIKIDPKLSLNECLGISNADYCTLSEKIQHTVLDALINLDSSTSSKSTVKYSLIAKELIEDIREKHLGICKDELSAYELELFIAGMAMRYVLLDDVKRSIECAAYAKKLEQGLNNL